MANERLRQAMKTAGLDVDQLAQAVQVDAKTVGRWLSGRVPYSRHRTRVARALGATERDLWPHAEIPDPAAAGSVELVAGFARTIDASPTWQTLLADAAERIWLLDFTLLDLLAADDTPALLAEKAARGVEVRLLISYATRARLAIDTPIDEPYPDVDPPAAFDIARARGHIEPLLVLDGIEARKFAAMRFNTIVCADDQMLITHHLWGQPTSQAPAIHLRRSDQPGLFAQYEHHYENVWEHAAHPIDPEPDLFPPPATNPTHYDALLFDDAPPDPLP